MYADASTLLPALGGISCISYINDGEKRWYDGGGITQIHTSDMQKLYNMHI